MQLKLELERSGSTTAENSLLLARGPFYQDSGGNWVFVLDEDGATAQRRTVSLGRSNPQQIEVIAGLNAGEQVVISSYRGLDSVERLVVSRQNK